MSRRPNPPKKEIQKFPKQLFKPEPRPYLDWFLQIVIALLLAYILLWFQFYVLIHFSVSTLPFNPHLWAETISWLMNLAAYLVILWVNRHWKLRLFYANKLSLALFTGFSTYVCSHIFVSRYVKRD